MRGMSSASNQNPSGSCAEVRQGGAKKLESGGAQCCSSDFIVPSPGSISRDTSLANTKKGILFHL